VRRPTSSPAAASVAFLLAAAAAAEPTARFDDVSRPSPRLAPGPAGSARALIRTASSPRDESWATRGARELVERARWLERNGEAARALRFYTDAIQMDPSHGPAHLGLGRLREALGDAVEAERAYGEATRIQAVAAEALALRARLRRSQGRRDAALADLQGAVALEATPPRVQLLAAWFVEAGAWPAALAAWRRLLAAAESGDPSVDAGRARVQVRALEVLAGESDPVSAGASHPAWERRALRAIARRKLEY
jgi:tetratricopeptide (TPR) repeat protein